MEKSLTTCGIHLTFVQKCTVFLLLLLDVVLSLFALWYPPVESPFFSYSRVLYFTIAVKTDVNLRNNHWQAVVVCSVSVNKRMGDFEKVILLLVLHGMV